MYLILTGLYSASEDGDCLDTTFYIHPTDEERDGQTNNCDGVTDLADAIDANTWYIDPHGRRIWQSRYHSHPLVQNPIVQCFSCIQYLLNDLDCKIKITIHPGMRRLAILFMMTIVTGLSIQDAVAVQMCMIFDEMDLETPYPPCTRSDPEYPTFEGGDCDDTDQTLNQTSYVT